MGLWEFSFFRKKIFQMLSDVRSWKKKSYEAFSIQKSEKKHLFFFKESYDSETNRLVFGIFFLMTFEYLESIAVNFAFSVSPLYNSSTPTNSSVGSAGHPQFQNSVHLHLSSL